MTFIFALLPSDEAVATSSLSVPPGSQMGLRYSHLVYQFDMYSHHLHKLRNCTLERNNSTLKVSSMCVDVHTSCQLKGLYYEILLNALKF